MGTETFYNVDWLAKAKATETPVWKELLYAVIDPPQRAWARSRLSGDFLRSLPAPAQVRTERGLSLGMRRRRAAEGLDLSRSTILVQGTGTGWDILSWARLKPRRIIGVDLYGFDSWEGVRRHCGEKHGVDVEFHESPLEACAFLADGAVDLAASDAVYEHCRDLDAVMAETRRVLRPGGFVYAAYGPLWYCAGGDHFSGREALRSSYNHVGLSPEQYQAYFEANRNSQEDFQDGGRYVELDLFSKLHTRRYLEIYLRNGFAVDSLAMEVSARALAFRKTHPAEFAALARRHPGVHPDDFLIKSNIIKLRKI